MLCRPETRMRAENWGGPNRSARPARWLQLRSPLSDCLRLETGQNTCKLERESRRGTGDPSAGFPLRCVGTRALAVRAEKTLAGEIVEGARDHRHGQQSFGRDGARDPVMGKRNDVAPPARLGISWSRCKRLLPRGGSVGRSAIKAPRLGQLRWRSSSKSAAPSDDCHPLQPRRAPGRGTLAALGDRRGVGRRAGAARIRRPMASRGRPAAPAHRAGDSVCGRVRRDRGVNLGEASGQ
jgi:hypothetical protein